MQDIDFESQEKTPLTKQEVNVEEEEKIEEKEAIIEKLDAEKNLRKLLDLEDACVFDLLMIL